jgi:hypothetical protein
MRHRKPEDSHRSDQLYQKRFACSQDFVLREIPILVLVMKVKEPFNVLHQIVEHDAVQARDQVLRLRSGQIGRDCSHAVAFYLKGKGSST